MSNRFYKKKDIACIKSEKIVKATAIRCNRSLYSYKFLLAGSYIPEKRDIIP